MIYIVTIGDAAEAGNGPVVYSPCTVSDLVLLVMNVVVLSL